MAARLVVKQVDCRVEVVSAALALWAAAVSARKVMAAILKTAPQARASFSVRPQVGLAQMAFLEVHMAAAAAERQTVTRLVLAAVSVVRAA